MVSKTKLQEINNYFENNYIPQEFNYNKQIDNVDWFKLDYTPKVKVNDFDIFFKEITNKLNNINIINDE